MAKQANRGFEVNPNKVLWEKGDFTRIAQSMRESGEALVKTLGITKGLKVLDLGCGDGTTALPAARLGAEVLGVDIASNLVAAGKQRANEQGLTRFMAAGVPKENVSFLRDTHMSSTFPARLRSSWPRLGNRIAGFRKAMPPIYPATCRTNWKRCSTARTKVRTRTRPPFRQRFCALLLPVIRS
jgi:SAM-dependent methyltransferase